MRTVTKASALKEASCPKPCATSFVKVPCCALRDPNLFGSDLRVYVVLLLLGGDSKKVESGLDEIADRTALSRRGANRSVMRLFKLGYINVQRRRRQTALITVRSPYDIYGNNVFDSEAPVAVIVPQRTKKLVRAHSAP